MKLDPATVIPGHEFARVTRFVSSLPGSLLCVVDRATNVCTVNQAVYDLLPRHQQKEVFRATSDITTVAPLSEAANDDMVFAGLFGAIA